MTPTDPKADEFYRNKLVDWMNSMDIPTGSGADTVDNCLEVVAAYITALRKQRQEEE